MDLPGKLGSSWVGPLSKVNRTSDNLLGSPNEAEEVGIGLAHGATAKSDLVAESSHSIASVATVVNPGSAEAEGVPHTLRKLATDKTTPWEARYRVNLNGRAIDHRRTLRGSDTITILYETWASRSDLHAPSEIPGSRSRAAGAWSLTFLNRHRPASVIREGSI
jgi:hypothetical protein